MDSLFFLQWIFPIQGLNPESACNAGDLGSVPGLGRSTGEGNGNPLQGICPTQGSNPGLPHCRQTLYPLSHQGSPKSIGVDSLFFLQWIFPIQGLNPGLLHSRQILYQLSHKGSPRILDWVAYPAHLIQFSRSVVSDSLRPHEYQHARPPCPSPTPGVHSDSRPLSQ